MFAHSTVSLRCNSKGEMPMDKDFFVQEIDAHLGVLYRVAFILLRNDEDCKDAISEATLKAWEKRHTLRDESRFKA